jgi:hypothetical protein
MGVQLLTLKHTIKYRILSAMVRTKSKALADRMWTGWKVPPPPPPPSFPNPLE